jgi:hypothetical protein
MFGCYYSNFSHKTLNWPMALSPVPEFFKNVNPAKGDGFLAPSEENAFSDETACSIEICDIS